MGRQGESGATAQGAVDEAERNGCCIAFEHGQTPAACSAGELAIGKAAAIGQDERGSVGVGAGEPAAEEVHGMHSRQFALVNP